jgi:hypothetical protein
MRKLLAQGALVALAICAAMEPALAQRRGGGGFRGGGARGGGGGFARASARPSVTMRPAGGANFNRASYNRTTVNRGAVSGAAVVRRPVRTGDVNIDRDWDDRYSGCCYYRPVARAAAVGAAAATAAAVGSAVYSVPSSCVSTEVNGATYLQCGSTWYRPEFNGTTTTYIVVSQP